MFLVPTSTAQTYITAPVQTLGAALDDSTYVTVMQVEKFDREKGLIVSNRVKDLKGKYPRDQVRPATKRGNSHAASDLKGKYPRDQVRHLFRLKNTPAHKDQGAVSVKPEETNWN